MEDQEIAEFAVKSQPTLKEQIEIYINVINNQATRRAACAFFISDNLDKFVELGVVPTGYDAYIDLDNLTRKQVIKAIKLFPGKYNKEVVGSTMHYERQLPTGLILRFYNAALPPGCRLVEKERMVPAKPATTEKFFEVQCGGHD